MTSDTEVPRSLDALASCAPELADAFVSLSGDIALVMDGGGVITRVAHAHGVPVAEDVTRWVGQPWASTVSGDTRQKIEAMLFDLQSTGRARKREVTLPLANGVSMPVAYTALQLGAGGPVIAVGRDLRAVAAIQQRFIDAQNELERSYWSTRHAEAHYELLFRVASDAVLTVAADDLQVIESNLVAPSVLAAPGAVPGRRLTELFAPGSRAALLELARRTLHSGQSAEITARRAADARAVAVAATPIRVDGRSQLLVRARPVRIAALDGPEHNQALARLVDSMSEGVVITDSAGLVLMANASAASLVGEAQPAALRLKPLGQWLGRVESDVAVLLRNVHQHGIARLQRSSLRGAERAAIDIDVCAVMLAEGDQQRFGFTIQPCATAPVPVAAHLAAELVHSLAVLDDSLGRETLSTLLARAGSAVERHLAQLALARSGGDMDTAASLLGIARERLAALLASVPEPALPVPRGAH